jgi:hypothetical protein
LQKPFILLSCILLPCILLSGCWQSDGSLFSNVKPVQPFRAGKLVSTNPDKSADIGHSLLTKQKDGSYRLTITDKEDRGDAMVLRFIALPGLPADMFVFEAVSDDACRPGQTCHPLTAQSERDYGLVRQTRTGADVFNPDCSKSGATAKLPGVKADGHGDCSFSNRASLEKALLDLARQSWKTGLTYNYE